MTIVRPALVLPIASHPVDRLRRWALVLGVLPTVACILVITLGPTWLVSDGLTAVTDGVDGVIAGFGWWVTEDQVEFLANIAMFVPLGISLGTAFRPRSWPLVVAVGGLLSGGVELAQNGLPGRVSDLRDVVANLAGDLCGLLIAAALVGAAGLVAPARPHPRSRRAPHLLRSVGIASAVAAAVVAAGALVVSVGPSGGADEDADKIRPAAAFPVATSVTPERPLSVEGGTRADDGARRG